MEIAHREWERFHDATLVTVTTERAAAARRSPSRTARLLGCGLPRAEGDLTVAGRVDAAARVEGAGLVEVVGWRKKTSTGAATWPSGVSREGTRSASSAPPPGSVTHYGCSGALPLRELSGRTATRGPARTRPAPRRCRSQWTPSPWRCPRASGSRRRCQTIRRGRGAGSSPLTPSPDTVPGAHTQERTRHRAWLGDTASQESCLGAPPSGASQNLQEYVWESAFDSSPLTSRALNSRVSSELVG